MENYTFDRSVQIGAGSFGTVYPGTKKGTGDIVALKAIIKYDMRENALRELRREWDIQKTLTHPNIIQFVDAFETDLELFVVTECAKESLYDLLRKEGQFGAEKVRVVACHLISALHYIHTRNIVHRDVKPQNVLIGNDGLYKLCDFGFAKDMQEALLTSSQKGTPLYMAQELLGVDYVAYDYKVDLWSLGCLLYELMVGKPPFPAEHVHVLSWKIKNDPVKWYPQISGDCLSFLQGLLVKAAERRLSWEKGLLAHSFIAGSMDLHIVDTEDESSLTRQLSRSQEVQKEQQRQEIQRRAEYAKKFCRKSKPNYLLVPQELHRCGTDRRLLQNPNSNLVLLNGGTPRQGFVPAKGAYKPMPTQMDATLQANLQTARKLKLGQNPSGPSNPPEWRKPKTTEDCESSDSSCETLTSSSDSDSENEDGGTVIVNGRLSKDSLRGSDEETKDQKSKLQKQLRKSLFTPHSYGSEDKPIPTEEWVGFLLKTMKEVIEAPKSLCEKNSLTLIVAPLRNHLTSSIVVEKIASLLSLPFILEEKKDANFIQSIENIYLDTKVVPNLLYSCKLALGRGIQRLGLKDDSIDLHNIASILTEEDLDGIDKSLRLLSFLVHSSDEGFVILFCYSIATLQAFAILHLFLKLDKRKSRIVTETLGILCHVMRTIPSNVNLLEDLLIADTLLDSELWRLLNHTNPLIRSRTMRILGYLVIHSERTKGQVDSRIWRLLLLSSTHADPGVCSAAKFAHKNIRYLGLGGSGNRSQGQSDHQSTDTVVEA